MARLDAVEEEARATALAIEFGFLLNQAGELLSIGYQMSDDVQPPDPSCHDLLASEARLASFVAIAKGDARPRAIGFGSAARSPDQGMARR